ncbi:hypothetical protein [Pseudomonas sp. CCI2.4]|uniref:hypothetical protein n=1 Tax=Pseudomonas sp. CCI2.4 TaxID=3048617 RepID=UPI002B239EB7|nr:hypothetical protein [Pseudomonas sp. CCI2.4]MEB0129726.1 hypothetical protein [Pseudomonas sp. CCI2.4]
MKMQNGESTPTDSLDPKKVIELFYVTHPKAPKALMGPFLNAADAEYGRVVMRSAGAQVTSSLIDGIDELTHWHGANNGAICRVFAGDGGHHE